MYHRRRRIFPLNAIEIDTSVCVCVLMTLVLLF